MALLGPGFSNVNSLGSTDFLTSRERDDLSVDLRRSAFDDITLLLTFAVFGRDRFRYGARSE